MSGAEIIKILKESLKSKKNYHPSDDLIIDEIPIIIDIIKKSKEKIDDNFNNSSS